MPPRAGLDRAAVLAAAAAQVDAAGLDALSPSAVAERLGVRAPTLYHYFDGLPGLRAALALHGTEELARRLGRAVQGRAGADALRALAAAYRAFVLEHPGLYAATVRPAGPAEPALAAAQTEVTTVVVQALAAYNLTGEAALHAVRALRSLVHGFATLESAGGFGLPLDLDTSFHLMVDRFLAGLSAPAPAPG